MGAPPAQKFLDRGLVVTYDGSMTGLEQYVDEHSPTPLIAVRVTVSRRARARWLPYFIGGLGLGLLIPALVIASGFAVDLGYYGGAWYAASVLWAAGYLGLVTGAVGVYFWSTKR